MLFALPTTYAQTNENVKVVTASETISNSNGFSIIVGQPYMGVTADGKNAVDPQVRFPWDVKYVYNTFNENNFEISKGYFTDKVTLNWTIHNNRDAITHYTIYRRVLSNVETSYTLIKQLSPLTTTYEDSYAEGGVLYEYKVVANGILDEDDEEKYVTYIDGVGFRVATATVTGSVRFEGSSPVRNVSVHASPTSGSFSSKSSAVTFQKNSWLEVNYFNGTLTDAFTFQSWIKPAKPFEANTDDPSIGVFALKNASQSHVKAVSVKLKRNEADEDVLEFNVDGSIFKIQNYIPSGELNARGDDILIPITEFNNRFTHVTVSLEKDKYPLLYINGRKIDQEYVESTHATALETDTGYEAPYFSLETTPKKSDLNLPKNSTWAHFAMGGMVTKSFTAEEARLWNVALDDETIRTDYKRYISGNDSRLICYLRFDEGVGRIAYDLSRNNFVFNKNHAELYIEGFDVDSQGVSWVDDAESLPNQDQLGFFGVTDSNGNYIINAVPYSGTGQSFEITPVLGVHNFEPNQQIVHLGTNNLVENKIDFTDTSSFTFKGQVLYDTRNVFKSFVELNSIGSDKAVFTGLDDGDQYVSAPGIIDEGYNYYEKNGVKYPKGEYWYNNAGTPDNIDDDYLERYARIASTDVNVFINGRIVLDKNNTPIATDDEGNFEIQVPIGNHYITVGKDRHEFNFKGRFPADLDHLSEFFEDREEVVAFVDNTRVTLVGRVVGGTVEANKTIGFGHDGLYTEQLIDENDVEEDIVISSTNNIGQASLTLDYTPPKGAVTSFTKFEFKTNEESGEYRVDLMPLKYEIGQIGGVKITSNDEISLLDAKEELDLSNIPLTTTPTVELTDDKTIKGADYHHEKSFIYRSTPILRVLEQNGERSITFKNKEDKTTRTFSTEGFSHLIYRQFKNYEIKLLRVESYVNNDTTPATEYLVPITDGEPKITNNAALAGSGTFVIDKQDKSKITYTFRGGENPSLTAPFTNSIRIQYLLNGETHEAENYDSDIILLGGKSDGSQTFVTKAPNTPDIILRDPPGSNSYATIESGETITLTTESEVTTAGGLNTEFKLLLGVKFAAGGGLAGPVIEAETTNSITAGFGVTTSSTEGEALTKTYTFSQSISTSAEANSDLLGANSDLYIGHSKNYFYGSYNDVDIREKSNGGDNELNLVNSEGETLYINRQKAIYVSEEPADTFFVYSQHYILNTLIPEFELKAANEENVDKKEFYQDQVNAWRSIVRENERVKYIAKNDRTAYKEELEKSIGTYISDISAALDTNNDPVSEDRLISKLNASRAVQRAILNNFENNISIDAGVGEISRSIETSIVNATTTATNLNIEETFAIDLGFNLNKFGLLNTTSGFVNRDINTAFSEEEESLTTISYVLSDNDNDNLLSVDVINSFDGNGPIFSLIGGRSSCPYIGEDKSVFYNNASYDSKDKNIQELAEEDRETLSNATQQVEVPKISVDVTEIHNVPETSNAEFTLELVNRSASESNASFVLFVRPESNENNAKINIGKGVSFVDVPFNEPFEYQLTIGKSISDIYDYEDIEIVLASECDPSDVFESVTLSAYFVPSCSSVSVSSPLENWVYNVNEAYNLDGSTNAMNIELSEYNLNFDSFEKIDLQFRRESSPTWTRLHTYYSTQDFYDNAVLNKETEISLISGSNITYQWDIAEQSLQNGVYEIRAISTCSNGTDFISKPIRGTVDLSAPVIFGTPSPTDGILSHGEDIRVRFNENVSYNTAVSLIEIKGETNQLPIDNNVSVYFDGAANTAIIENPYITSGDFSFEFWMNNNTTNSQATVVHQEDGFSIRLQNNTVVFNFGAYTASGIIASNDGLFHHYSFTYNAESGALSIYQDDKVIKTSNAVPNLTYSFSNPITIGGNSFVGGIHDVRLWSKALTLTDAFANIYTQYMGNEPDLIGYWPMTEGRGTITRDLARSKHMQLNGAQWDIKPKGNSYSFASNQYLTLDEVGFVNLNDLMDFTLSFWIKTGQSQTATLFSNGRGDGTDIILPNGTYNKWAVTIGSDGNISFDSEGKTYQLTSSSVADNTWHHVAVLMNRQGNLDTYVDNALVTSHPNADIKGFSSDTIWVGARGHRSLANEVTVDQMFTGNLDEIRLWNTLRSKEQVSRDRFNEVDFNSTGLLLYLKMTQPEPPTGNGPRYYHRTRNSQTTNSLAKLSSGSVNYDDDTPPIKPERKLTKFRVRHVINGDEMIIEPEVSNDASIEGQVLDITVHRMFDEANNIQQSPITWTAFINRDQLSWSIDGEKDVVEAQVIPGEEKTLEIIVRNGGGTAQPYSITNVPSWLSIDSTSGTIEPSSVAALIATIDTELGYGYYEHDLFLETALGFNQKIQLQIEVMPTGPDWNVRPEDFDYSLNIIGRVKLNNVFSENPNNKIAAFVDGEVRGVANLVYDPDYRSHFVYLTVHSNSVNDKEVTFSIWNALSDIVHEATINGENSITFIDNGLFGTKSSPSLFENTQSIQQTVLLNSGWTWISFYLAGTDFSDINSLTDGMKLEASDRMLSHSPSYLEVYDNGAWSGTLSANGGLDNRHMYKMRFNTEQPLLVSGVKVDLETWRFEVKQNWNWLPYVVTRNAPLKEAMANFNPSDGDVIKSQDKFSIYDALSGWSGSLTHFEVGKGYMLRSATSQTFRYPAYLNDGAEGLQFNSRRSSLKTAGNANKLNQYSSNMNAVVRLPSGYTTLYAYDMNGQLRGKAKAQAVNNDALCFITIAGDIDEHVIFHMGNELETKPTSKIVSYSSDGVLGTVQNPLIISETTETIDIYPNPFSKEITLQMGTETAGEAHIQIHDVSGRILVDTKKKVQQGDTKLNINLDVPSGVYFLEVRFNNLIQFEKIVKK